MEILDKYIGTDFDIEISLPEKIEDYKRLVIDISHFDGTNLIQFDLEDERVEILDDKSFLVKITNDITIKARPGLYFIEIHEVLEDTERPTGKFVIISREKLCNFITAITSYLK